VSDYLLGSNFKFIFINDTFGKIPLTKKILQIKV